MGDGIEKIHIFPLIPDSPFKKIWYATLMEHESAGGWDPDLCAGGIRVGDPKSMSCSVFLIYTVLQANKLYLKVIAQWMVGELLGKTGRN